MLKCKSPYKETVSQNFALFSMLIKVAELALRQLLILKFMRKVCHQRKSCVGKLLELMYN